MLSESDVISSVCKHFELQGYEIVQRLAETEQGDDIIAMDGDGNKCFIEAKGETSSKKTSSRYGKAFSSSQIGVHVAKAFYRAVQMKEENPDTSQVGIALPDTPGHQKKVAKIKGTLALLSIEVFWVTSDGSIRTQGNWNNN